jgi:phenylacetate-coenzyme A ligase PaaK-like adenylate-forming protein
LKSSRYWSNFPHITETETDVTTLDPSLDARAHATETPATSVVPLDSRFLEPAIETAPRAEIEAWQEARIVELVQQAWDKSRFYRELWGNAGVHPSDIKTLEDFTTRIPTFAKSDTQAYRDRTGDAFGGLLCMGAHELTSLTATSGTTGDPELIAESWDAVPPLPMITARDLWELGLRPGDRVLIPSGAFRNFWDGLFNLLGAVPVFVDGWIGQGESVLAAVKKYQPAYLQLYLPNILEFERLEATHDLRSIFSCLKGVAFAGQPMGAALARKVRDEWGLEIFTYTSAGDTGTAWEHKEHDGYTLWEDTVFPECLDPVSDSPVPDGEVGELVATDIDNTAAPLIRYRSGDLVRLTRKPAASGRTHARQWVVGRKGDETIIAGRPVVLGEVWAAVEELPELGDGMFQIIRHSPGMDTLRLRVGYAPERTTDLLELERRLRAHLQDRLGVPCHPLLVPVDELLTQTSSTAKFPRVVKK